MPCCAELPQKRTPIALVSSHALSIPRRRTRQPFISSPHFLERSPIRISQHREAAIACGSIWRLRIPGRARQSQHSGLRVPVLRADGENTDACSTRHHAPALSPAGTPQPVVGCSFTAPCCKGAGFDGETRKAMRKHLKHISTERNSPLLRIRQKHIHKHLIAPTRARCDVTAETCPKTKHARQYCSN